MNKKSFLSLLLIAASALPTGCMMQSPSPQAAPQQEYYYEDYRPWGGPGWYYGVYFYNESGYRGWRRRHWNRRQGGQWRDGRRHGGWRGSRHGGGRAGHHGGGGRRGGGHRR